MVTGCQEHKSCGKVLNFLERLDDRIRCTHEETIAVVKPWEDIGCTEGLTSVWYLRLDVLRPLVGCTKILTCFWLCWGSHLWLAVLMFSFVVGSADVLTSGLTYWCSSLSFDVLMFSPLAGRTDVLACGWMYWCSHLWLAALMFWSVVGCTDVLTSGWMYWCSGLWLDVLRSAVTTCASLAVNREESANGRYDWRGHLMKQRWTYSEADRY